MKNTLLRTLIECNNIISTDRMDYSEYVAPVRGSKECAICNVMTENDPTYIKPWSRVERDIDAPENERKPRVKNRVQIQGFERGVFLCDRHMHHLRLALGGYCLENKIHSGKPTKDGLTISFEIETSDMSDICATTLVVVFKAIPTSDSTVYIELKSPIFDSLHASTKLLGTMEYFLNNGGLEIDSSCGTHLHCGTIDNSIDFERLLSPWQNYKAFFEKTALYISRGMSEEKRIEYFGRDFGTWAKRVFFGDTFLKCDNRVLYDMSACHVSAFNVQHSYSIEFRLPKFIGANQYRKCILAMQNMVAILKDTFLTCGGYNISVRDLETAGAKVADIWKKIFPSDF